MTLHFPDEPRVHEEEPPPYAPIINGITLVVFIGLIFCAGLNTYRFLEGYL